jgi:hypothetical protein
MTNVSTTAIWDCLKNKTDLMEVLKDIPDEYYAKIKNYENALKFSFNVNKDSALKHFKNIPKADRKTQSEWIFKTAFPFFSILFNMLDGKNIDNQLWDLIKPKFEKL